MSLGYICSFGAKQTDYLVSLSVRFNINLAMHLLILLLITDIASPRRLPPLLILNSLRLNPLYYLLSIHHENYMRKMREYKVHMSSRYLHTYPVGVLGGSDLVLIRMAAGSLVILCKSKISSPNNCTTWQHW